MNSTVYPPDCYLPAWRRTGRANWQMGNDFPEDFGLGSQRFSGMVFANTPLSQWSDYQSAPRTNLIAKVFFGDPQAPLGISELVNRITLARSAELAPSLRQRIGGLSDLKDNWDGEAAKPVKVSVLRDAVEFLHQLTGKMDSFREPFLAPTFDGYVQFEWHDKKRSLEIEAVSEGWAVVGSLAQNESQRLYFEAECERSDFTQLAKFYEWFVGDELIWPSR